MPNRTEVAHQTAAGLRRFAQAGNLPPVLLGFDGFVDSIIHVVDKRYDASHFEPIRTIEQFGRKIVAAARQSSNYELVVQLQKLGGNGPIMANALAALGMPVTYIGSLGYPTIHPVFREFTQHAKCYSVAEPGLTDALEFEDGKLMLGKHASLRDICWQQVLKVVGLGQLRELIQGARLIGMVNWTMLPCLSEIWQQVIDEILSAREEQVTNEDSDAGKSRPSIFIDLADPEKRTRDDLCEALELCTRFQRHAEVTLGLNLKEAVQVAGALHLDVPSHPALSIEPLAVQIGERLGIHTVVVHPRDAAAAATSVDGIQTSSRFSGPFTTQPQISTGAGDNFNAGFCLGRLAQLPLAESLCAATAVSGFYVREARSPTLEELIQFIEKLPPPEHLD